MMISLLLVNIGLGIITRSAPSLNIIAVGFPAILLIGSILLIVALPGVLRLIQDFWIESFEKMTLMIGI
jgi:flagellar biosynthetic protein FliR